MVLALLLESPDRQLYLYSEIRSVGCLPWVIYDFIVFIAIYFFGDGRREINKDTIISLPVNRVSLLGRQPISSVDSRYLRVLNKNSWGEVDKFENSYPRIHSRCNFIRNSK